jgi:hypothetical protein
MKPERGSTSAAAIWAGSFAVKPEILSQRSFKPAIVQIRLGHASIRMTVDRYCRARSDDGGELAPAEKSEVAS